jgi:hypothetical protein
VREHPGPIVLREVGHLTTVTHEGNEQTDTSPSGQWTEPSRWGLVRGVEILNLGLEVAASGGVNCDWPECLSAAVEPVDPERVPT